VRSKEGNGWLGGAVVVRGESREATIGEVLWEEPVVVE